MALRLREYKDRLSFVQQRAEEIGLKYGSESIDYDRRMKLMNQNFRDNIPERVAHEAAMTGTDFELPPCGCWKSLEWANLL